MKKTAKPPAKPAPAATGKSKPLTMASGALEYAETVAGIVEGTPSKKVKLKVKRRAGRKRERTQISVRIDRNVMALAYMEIQRTRVHISDLLERGLLLALREHGAAPESFATARILLYDRGVEFARRCEAMAALEVIDQVRPLSPAERFLRDFHLQSISDVRRWDGYAEAQKLLAQEHSKDIAERA